VAVVDPTSLPDVPGRPARTRPAGGSHPIARFLLRRTAIGILLVIAVSLFVFLATEILPGDAARAVLGAKASDAQVAEVRDALGLDRPMPARYVSWMSGMLHGDLGDSLVAGGASSIGSASARTPVSKLIAEPVRNTLVLGLVTVALLIPLSFGLGVLAGMRPGRWLDNAISGLTLAGLAVPDFIVGTLLILVFAIQAGLLPPVSLVAPGTSPLSDPRLLVLPVATLLVVTTGFAARQIRAGVVRAMESDYVEMARLNGIRESRIIIHWALRNSIAPSIQTLTQVVQYLLGGVVLTEAVFSYPGIGMGLVQYVAARDIPVVQSVTVLVAATYVALNIIADLLVTLVVPRLRTAR
jgi:peptide/nickel transport system permease protein